MVLSAGWPFVANHVVHVLRCESQLSKSESLTSFLLDSIAALGPVPHLPFEGAVPHVVRIPVKACGVEGGALSVACAQVQLVCPPWSSSKLFGHDDVGYFDLKSPCGKWVCSVAWLLIRMNRRTAVYMHHVDAAEPAAAQASTQLEQFFSVPSMELRHAEPIQGHWLCRVHRQQRRPALKCRCHRLGCHCS